MAWWLGIAFGRFDVDRQWLSFGLTESLYRLVTGRIVRAMIAPTFVERD